MPGRKKTKKANGEGSTYQRKKDGRWVGQLTLTDGRRKFFYGKSHDEVHRELTKALADQQRGLPILGSRQTVAQFLERWLTTSKRSQLRPRTYARYEALVRLHVTPQIGSVLLHKLSPQHLADLYSTLATAPPPSKRGPSRTRLSKRTVQFVHAILHGALKRAVKWRLIALNPADAVDAPRPERHEMHALTQEQARLLLHAAEGERLEALYVLALSTGMRLGELLGLRWRDVDLKAGRLQVRTTLQRVDGQWLFAEPKTQRSRRSITLSAFAANALRAHRARQLDEIRALGPAWVSYDLVFCNATGEPLHGTNFGKQYFHPLLKRAGLPRIRPHDLRHSTATILLEGNVHPKYVQDLLGHSQISMTLDTYSHVTQNMQQQVADHMDAVLANG